MAQMFDVLTHTNTHLNQMAKYFSKESSSIRTLPEIPSFLFVSLSRALDSHPAYCVDTDKDNGIKLASYVDTDDAFNPLYICAVDNISTAIVDKVPIYVNRNDKAGAGIAYIVFVPIEIFDDDAVIENVSGVLKDIYFGLLNLDSNMQYAADAALFRMSESSKVRVHTYDITMAYIALSCVNINLRAWYSDNGKPLDAKYAVDAFTDAEITPSMKAKISKTLGKYAIKIGTLRDAMASGEILMNALYEK